MEPGTITEGVHMDRIDRDTIKRLRDEAGQHGDHGMVILCERWLRGLTRLAEDNEIRRVLDNASAQREDTGGEA